MASKTIQLGQEKYIISQNNDEDTPDVDFESLSQPSSLPQQHSVIPIAETQLKTPPRNSLKPILEVLIKRDGAESIQVAGLIRNLLKSFQETHIQCECVMGVMLELIEMLVMGKRLDVDGMKVVYDGKGVEFGSGWIESIELQEFKGDIVVCKFMFHKENQ